MVANNSISAVLVSTDLETSRGFYEDKVGLKFSPGTIKNHLLFDCGNGTTLLIYGRGAGNKADHTQVRFWSTDIDTDVAELVDRGIEFEEYDMDAFKTINHVVTSAGIGRSAWFKDPDGNTFGGSACPMRPTEARSTVRALARSSVSPRTAGDRPGPVAVVLRGAGDDGEAEVGVARECAQCFGRGGGRQHGHGVTPLRDPRHATAPEQRSVRPGRPADSTPVRDSSSGCAREAIRPGQCRHGRAGILPRTFLTA